MYWSPSRLLERSSSIRLSASPRQRAHTDGPANVPGTSFVGERPTRFLLYEAYTQDGFTAHPQPPHYFREAARPLDGPAALG